MKRKIKILHVVLSLDYGGTEKIVVDVINNLSRDKFESSVICMDRYGQRVNDVKKDVPIYLMDRKPGISPKNFYTFYKLFKYVNPDIVHFRNFTTYYWGCIGCKLKKNTRIVYSDNSNIVQDYENNNKLKLLVRRLLKCITDNYMTNSSNFKSKFVECVRLDAEDVEVIPNGVDTEKFYPMDIAEKKSLRTHFKFSVNDYLIGIVAGLRPVKNLSLPIKAMVDIISRFPSAKLVLVGEGEQKMELKALAQNCGLSDKVHFLGLIKEVNDILNIFDMFLFTSSSAEGMPNAVLEAMAAKVPIIASDISGNVEILQNGNRGFLFKNNDKDSLIEIVLRLANDKALRDQVATKAYRYVKDNLSLSIMIKRYEDFYRAVYNRHR